jgi:hypothetical protein
MEGGGISLQINQITCKIVLDEFLVEGQVKAVGNLDNTISNDKTTFLVVSDGVATPWHQHNPLKPISYAQGILKIEDILLIYPTDPAEQAKIKLMPRNVPAILYGGGFAIQGNVFMGADGNLETVMDAVVKNFLTLTQVSVFPLFPAKTSIPEVIPLALLNKAKIYQHHGVS